ncbi:MAG: nucleotidyl transferase AbiEii/AbiGii toxin family protein [Sedimentisphaerales bacterium]|nr:nucleotidyl transferase AbiEii/AbiGii toxin family protein [Sedimentisphaerales bacterium]
MIEELLKNIAQCLDDAKIPYMIIGGQAVLLYGTPRLTRDIDITLGVDTDKFSLIKEVCSTLNLRIIPDTPEDFARETKVLPAEEIKSRIRVDFIFSFTGYESQAINRTKEVQMHGYPVKFASCEDLIIHKMIAARAIDAEDVKNILIKNKDSIDLEYVRKWLSDFSELPEHKGILESFNNLLKQ